MAVSAAETGEIMTFCFRDNCVHHVDGHCEIENVDMMNGLYGTCRLFEEKFDPENFLKSLNWYADIPRERIDYESNL